MFATIAERRAVMVKQAATGGALPEKDGEKEPK